MRRLHPVAHRSGRVAPALLLRQPRAFPSLARRLIFSSLQYSVGTLEIHPGSSDPGDHEIRAPHAVEDCTRADQRYAIDDPGLRFIELTLFRI